MTKIVQPKILSGFMELLPEEQILFNKVYDTIRNVYEQFGFLPLDTPTIEYSEILLAKAGAETEKQIYRFNKGDNDLSLRFDLTVPLARYVVQHYPYLTFPFKRYQMSKVFRGERPQRGRFREFYQCDIDVIGDGNLPLVYDAEMPAIIHTIFKKLNLGNFVIHINNRKILNGFFQELGLTNYSGDILRTLDKIEKIGKEKVRDILIDYNIDERTVDGILRFIGIKGTNRDVISSLKNNDISNIEYNNGVQELESVVNWLTKFGLTDDDYRIDLTIARGLDYYTGTVYETILTDYPSLGSICSGGRYDNLTGYYSDKQFPGVGISIGLTRLFSQLRAENIISLTKKSLIDILIVPLDDDNMDYVFNIANMLRNAQFKIDIYYGDKGLKQKMKYADRLGVPYVIVIGTDEVDRQGVNLKNMITGTQSFVKNDDLVNVIKNID